MADDARLLEVQHLSVDESALIGETLSVPTRTTALTEANTPLTDHHDIVYAGTLITGGQELTVKDLTRIERIGAYAAWYATKNVVAAGLADECAVQLSYSIGQACPISIQLQSFATHTIPDDAITALVAQHFDFCLTSIIQRLQLRFLPTRTSSGLYQKLVA